MGSNNTNKWNAQEHPAIEYLSEFRSNNTNKWNAQEPIGVIVRSLDDQIIPINGMLKNSLYVNCNPCSDQIIPINGMLKNAIGNGGNGNSIK